MVHKQGALKMCDLMNHGIVCVCVCGVDDVTVAAVYRRYMITIPFYRSSVARN